MTKLQGGGIGIGLALGAGIGVAMDNIAMGIAIGLTLGAAFDWSSRKKDGGDKGEGEGDDGAAGPS